MHVLHGKRRALLAGTTVALVFAGVPIAFAADGANLSATVIDTDVVVAKATGFESGAEIEVVAAVTGGSGEATVTANANGLAVIAFMAPDGYSGKVTITATSGSDEVTDTATFAAAIEEADEPKAPTVKPPAADVEEPPAVEEDEDTAASDAPSTGNGATLGSSVKVLAFGDSITQGGGTTGAWRGPILPMLEGLQGTTFDFVGGEVDLSGPAMSDKEHEGHSGWTVEGLNDIAADRVSTYDPDLVTILAGTNDLLRDVSAVEGNARMKALIDNIWSAKPDAVIIVGEISPMKEGSFANDGAIANYADYNALNQGMIDSLAAQGKPISYAPTGLTTSDLQDDGVHMLESGNTKLAEGFFAAIKKFVG